jgi:hypothetical protein
MGDRVVKVDDLAAFIEANKFECEDQPPPPPPPGKFGLIWPTPLPKVVTQWYGINPQWYGPNLPGHEGIDMRAAMGVEIYAAAKGQVIRVQEPDDGGPYGIHVRIEHVHPDGKFKTVYAHFLDAFVLEGEMVEVGQPIGFADNTGNSSGAHLHLTLKHVNQGSPWMGVGDIINPVPYISELFPICTLDGYTGAGWIVDVGGNFRATPEVPADSSENLIRWIPANVIGQATGLIGGDGGDWWEMIFDGTQGWFWNPGFKLRAL